MTRIVNYYIHKLDIRNSDEFIQIGREIPAECFHDEQESIGKHRAGPNKRLALTNSKIYSVRLNIYNSEIWRCRKISVSPRQTTRDFVETSPVGLSDAAKFLIQRLLEFQ